MVGSNAKSGATAARSESASSSISARSALLNFLDVDAVLDRGAVALRESFPTPCRWLAVPVAPVLGRRLGAHAALRSATNGQRFNLCARSTVLMSSLARLLACSLG